MRYLAHALLAIEQQLARFGVVHFHQLRPLSCLASALLGAKGVQLSYSSQFDMKSRINRWRLHFNTRALARRSRTVS